MSWSPFLCLSRCLQLPRELGSPFLWDLLIRLVLECKASVTAFRGEETHLYNVSQEVNQIACGFIEKKSYLKLFKNSKVIYNSTMKSLTQTLVSSTGCSALKLNISQTWLNGLHHLPLPESLYQLNPQGIQSQGHHSIIGTCWTWSCPWKTQVTENDSRIQGYGKCTICLRCQGDRVLLCGSRHWSTSAKFYSINNHIHMYTLWNGKTNKMTKFHNSPPVLILAMNNHIKLDISKNMKLLISMTNYKLKVIKYLEDFYFTCHLITSDYIMWFHDNRITERICCEKVF